MLTAPELLKLIKAHNILSKITIPKKAINNVNELIKLIESKNYSVDHNKKSINPKVQRGKQITLKQAEEITKPKVDPVVAKQKREAKKKEKEEEKKKEIKIAKKEAVQEFKQKKQEAEKKKPKPKPPAPKPKIMKKEDEVRPKEKVGRPRVDPSKIKVLERKQGGEPKKEVKKEEPKKEVKKEEPKKEVKEEEPKKEDRLTQLNNEVKKEVLPIFYDWLKNKDKQLYSEVENFSKWKIAPIRDEDTNKIIKKGVKNPRPKYYQEKEKMIKEAKKKFTELHKKYKYATPHREFTQIQDGILQGRGYEPLGIKRDENMIKEFLNRRKLEREQIKKEKEGK